MAATESRPADSTVLQYAQSSLDRIIPPTSRQAAYDQTSSFAVSRPVLFSFLVVQLIFAFLPLMLFISFAVSTIAFALGAALVFSLFWIGVAFMLLVPTLLGTASVAILVWAWGMGSFMIARWLHDWAMSGSEDDSRKRFQERIAMLAKSNGESEAAVPVKVEEN